MKDDLYNTRQVNPAWLKQHISEMLNRIYELINKKEHPTDEELLIQAWIEFEWYRLKLPRDWV